MRRRVNDLPASRSSPPRRGVSLGWRLSLSTVLVVTAAMGGITFLQQLREIGVERRAAATALRASLAPLVSDLERAETMAEAQRHVAEFHGAYVKDGNPDHRIQLRAEDGGVVYSTAPLHAVRRSESSSAEVPVRSKALKGGRGSLRIEQSSDALEATIAQKWRDWWLHISITLASILLFLHFVIRRLVTRPLERLLEGIRKMEMGYWGEVPPTRGAWEIRWLRWRFQNMGLELQRTVQHLLEAEKKAAKLVSAPAPPRTPEAAADRRDVAASAEPRPRRALRELQQLCDRLESGDPKDPQAQATASEVMESSVVDAERHGAMALKTRLENAALHILEPHAFLQLDGALDQLVRTRRRWIERCGEALHRGLAQEMVPVRSLHYRVKHTAGVWAKMRDKGLTLDQVHDLFAFRIVVPTGWDCYWALGVVHDRFEPIVGRFKDYIVAPKPNGYQALHTCVRTGGSVFEVQIRSSAMHRAAEDGSASHLDYKRSSDGYESVAFRAPRRGRRSWRWRWQSRRGRRRSRAAEHPQRPTVGPSHPDLSRGLSAGRNEE